MRFMSQDGTATRQHNGQTYRSVWRSFRVIYQEEGIRPFFRGVHVAVLGSVCAWGVYMYIYRWECARYAAYKEAHATDLTASKSDGTGQKRVIDAGMTDTLGNLLQRFGFSIIASCTSAVVCNPIWLTKTRMQLEESSARVPGTARHYQTFTGGVVYAVRTSGVWSLWRGVSAQLLLGIPNAFNLPLYDTIKSTTMRLTQQDSLSVLQVCVCSTITKVVLAVVCHPIAVLKARLQDQRAREGEVQYRSLNQAVRTVWVRGGVKDLYRGMVPSLYHTVPRSVLMFVFYEKCLQLIRYTQSVRKS